MSDESEMVLTELSEKSDQDLRGILDKLDTDEQRLSYERRLLHAKIDILKAELLARIKEKHRRGKSMVTGRDLERLTEILARDLTKKAID
ncbi:MAG: hypothetical protein Q8L35_07530 [Actinomycetota bacterium]|nr:hypothetical protein [Actinomycetota bacterium]